MRTSYTLSRIEAVGACSESCSALAERTRRETFVAECLLAKIQVALARNESTEGIALLKRAIILRGQFLPVAPALIRLDPEFDDQRASGDFRALF